MIKKWLISLLSTLLVVNNIGVLMVNMPIIYTANAEEEKEEAEWELVFNDDFDGTEINMDNWSFDHPENGRYNGEIQSYTDQNAWVEDGHLIIEAREEEFTEENGETYDYTSSKLITKGKQTWTYGKIEIRAKMPEGQGMWPALWMMPEDEPFYGTWPVGGEIDIMEMLGHEPDRIHSNIHYGDPKGEDSKTYILPEGESFADDFYVYTLEWEPGEIRWYIDDELYHTANDWHSKHPGNADDFAYPAPFDQDFFLIMNISVGGGWPGNPDGTTPLPQQMVVDYVRVYQKDEYPIREKPGPSEEDLYGREPLEDGNYIYNGNFNSNNPEIAGITDVPYTDYWTFGTDGGGAADLSVEDEILHLGITSGGNVEHGVQLLQSPVRLEEGATYKASFNARAESERTMKVKIGGGGDRGWADYANIAPVTLTEELESYEYEFVMPESTDTHARFEFNMGLNNSDIWLSEVRLEKIADGGPITEPEEQPRPALPTGNYVYNGTFDQGNDRFAFWEFRTDESADADWFIGSSVNERILETRISDGGNQADSIQLIQPKVNLTQGNSYQLAFEANAETPRDIQVDLVALNGEVIATETVAINQETKVYTVEFDVDIETNNDVELQFNLGGNDTNVNLDNVFLSRVLASDGIGNNLIRNGIFDSLAYWNTENNHSVAEFRADEGFHVNIADPGDATWAIQLFQNEVPLKKGETYEVSFNAKSTIPRPILFQLEHGTDYTKYFSTNVELSEEWDTYTYQFTMDHESDLNTKFGFSFGGDGTDAIPTDEHEVSLNNIVVTKVVEDPTEEDNDTENSNEEGTETDDSNGEESTGDEISSGDNNSEDTNGEGTDSNNSNVEDSGKEDSETETKDESELPKTGVASTNFIGIGATVLLLGIALAYVSKKVTNTEK